MRFSKWLMASFGLLILAAACGPRMTRSSFLLENDVPYRVDPHDKDVLIYSNPNLKATTYSKFLIEPVRIYSNDSLSIKPEEEIYLADLFRKDLINALAGYQIVDKAGADILRIRIAIQDIQPAEVDFVEEGAIVLRLDTWLARVAMELDCVDSVTGERVAALVHTLRDNRYFEKEKKTRLLNIREAFNVWTKELRMRFDAAKARANFRLDGPDPEENRRLRFEEGE